MVIIGLLAGLVCLWGVTGLKKLLGADDSLDVFGVHGVGGILGALLTGVFAAPSLGGTGVYDYVANAVGEYSMSTQLVSQAWGVGVAIVWSTVVSIVAFKIADMTLFVGRTAMSFAFWIEMWTGRSAAIGVVTEFMN